MSVHNLYPGCRAFSSAGRLFLPSVCSARGCHGNWNPASVHSILCPALLLQLQSRCLPPLLHIWISPLLLMRVTPKRHFSELRLNSGLGRCFIIGWISTSRWIRRFMRSVFFKVLCALFNSLAIVLDLIFCLRKRACTVHWPWGRVCACSNVWEEVPTFLKLCTSNMHTINVQALRRNKVGSPGALVQWRNAWGRKIKNKVVQIYIMYCIMRFMWETG